MGLGPDSDEVTVEELRGELEDLRTLVHTLLTIIMEEAMEFNPAIPLRFQTNQNADIRCESIFHGFGSLISKYTKRP